MPELKAPPKPKWKGTPPNLVAKYLDFVRAQSERTFIVRRQQLQREIDSLEDDKRYNTSESSYYREAVARYEREMAEHKEKLVPLDDLSRFDEGLINLLDYPNLLGIRPDSRGCIVAHVRTYFPKGDGVAAAYLGDFEVGLRFVYSSDYGDTTVEVAQTDSHCRNHWSGGFTRSTHEDRVSYGRLHFYERGRRAMMSEGRFTDLLDDFTRMIVGSSTTRNNRCQAEEPEPPTWTGITSDLEYMLRQTLDLTVNGPAHEKIAKTAKELASAKTSVSAHIRRVREISRALSQKRAELEQMDAAPQDGDFDEDDAREQLQYITSLPGIMGIRFERYDGIDVPVLHVRASTLYGERLYDVGDFEIMFRETHDTSSVVPVTQTRASTTRYNTLYYHPGGGYNWFCFGQRGGELQGLFRRGDYGQFVQIAINTINSINRGDQPYIPDYYRPIPLNATWRPLSETLRRRPRRRLREMVSTLV